MFQPAESQRKLFGGYNLYSEWVGEKTFFGWLGREGKQIFPDEMFRSFYSEKVNGRPCVPPSLLAVAFVLQMYCKCSDQEAVERSLYDARWWVALDIKPETKPFAKSTLQKFRAQVHLSKEAEELFLRQTLKLAKRAGMITGDSSTVAIDTTPMFGRGATKDTYGLVADGIKILCRALSMVTGTKLQSLAHRLNLTRYLDKTTSIKGSAGIDWSDAAARRRFLNELVDDAKRLLTESGRIKSNCTEKQKQIIEEAEGLLQSLLVQDTEPDPDDPDKIRIKEGVSRDRKPSATDPEVRHTRKSSSSRSDGHKVAHAVETESGLVAAVDVIPGNAHDSTGSLELVESAEANIGIPIPKTIGDCAYGNGETRQAFKDADREIVTKVPSPPEGKPFHKAHFDVDLENNCVTCPTKQSTSDFKYETSNGATVKRFYFPVEVCQPCPHRDECLTTKRKDRGRSVGIHPQEDLLQEAREYAETPEFKEDMRLRQKVEHSFARGMHLGLRQARYIGRAKSKVQAVLTATALNLVLIFGFLSMQQNPAAETLTSPSRMKNSNPNYEIAPEDSSLKEPGYPNGQVNCNQGPDSPASSRGDPSRGTIPSGGECR